MEASAFPARSFAGVLFSDHFEFEEYPRFKQEAVKSKLEVYIENNTNTRSKYKLISIVHFGRDNGW